MYNLVQLLHDGATDWETLVELEYKGHRQSNTILLREMEEGNLLATEGGKEGEGGRRGRGEGEGRREREGGGGGRKREREGEGGRGREEGGRREREGGGRGREEGEGRREREGGDRVVRTLFQS